MIRSLSRSLLRIYDEATDPARTAAELANESKRAPGLWGALFLAIAMVGEMARPGAVAHLTQTIAYVRPPRTEAQTASTLVLLDRKIRRGLLWAGLMGALSLGLLISLIVWIVRA